LSPGGRVMVKKNPGIKIRSSNIEGWVVRKRRRGLNSKGANKAKEMEGLGGTQLKTKKKKKKKNTGTRAN